MKGPELTSADAAKVPNASPEPIAESTPDRLTAPTDGDGQSPRLPFTVVGVGASAGGLEAFSEFLAACDPKSGMAFVLVQHLSPKHQSLLAELLQKHTKMPVFQVEDAQKVEPNHVYVIRPGFTMRIHGGHLHLGESAAERMHRRPIDDFFKSLAEEQRERAVAVILSGTGSNGTSGCESIKAVGGFCLAEDPQSARFPAMPRSLIDANLADAILQPREMFAAIRSYAGHPYASGEELPTDVVAMRERRALGDVIAVLRARTRHDFSVYKKPTLIRRIQRRMSLMQLESMTEYVRALRQTPGEVAALADDLMIHVTGFFRDPEVWESLEQRVIRPLVAQKHDDATIRCWVTACSSGEEAYTIGMLLLESAERIGKHFDIKIFATDTAERSLNQARLGIFPGGIEAEITPERLDRFFEKDDAHYRVKKQLRELVVFAPQNVLQDPPFSRLDLCTCRNLLIYIEGETQRRILSMLHFGLREGGALVLGNSETITGAEDLFEPIDKAHRIYRRVGPTRHGMLDFPSPIAGQLAGRGPGGADGDEPAAGESRHLPRATISQLANKTLLERYTPAAVVIDRSGQVVHFHGNTEKYLVQPGGEPTRELIALACDEIRGGVRTTLQRAISANEHVRHRDGFLGEGAERQRVEITAAPLGGMAGVGHFLVSFDVRPDPPPVPSEEDDAANGRLAEELRRTRDELQSTIEELQTSNEEMKASHEEVTSVNEELQSANEELETSKEELQSLNEELTTVNAQLQAKMEELERTTNDIGSLLSSTDIAVIFLDTSFRIRRFTPASRELIELIPGDVGRPLRDLAWKFDDATLMADAAAVLARLVPIERDLVAHDGRAFVRRALPYRTADNRIEGVVVTFIDVTDRRRSEDALRASEDRFRRIFDIDVVGVLVFDESGTLVEANNAFLKMSGYTRAEVAARALNWRLLTPPEFLAESERQMAQLPETGRIGPYEKEYFRRDGSRTWMLFAGAAVGDGTIVEFCVDVSDRRHVEEKLRDSEALLRRALDAPTVGVLFFNLDGTITDANATFERMSGYTADELRALPDWSVLTAADSMEVTRRAAADLAERGETLPYEKDMVRKDGTRRRGLFAPARLSGSGRRTRCVEFILDLTDRREMDARIRAMASNLPGGAAFIVGSDLRYQLAGGEALAMSGRTPADFEGRTLWEALEPDVADLYASNYRRALAGESFTHEHVEWGRHYVTRGVPLRDADGNVKAALAVSYDVTERREIEQRVDQEQRRFEQVVQNLPDYAIFLLDPNGVITGWWEGAENVTGYANDEARGKHVRIFYPPELDDEPERELRIAAEAGRSEVEGWRVRKDGTRYWVNEIVTAIHNSGDGGDRGTLIGFAKIARDLTERKRADEELVAAKNIAERASRAKDEFLATLSHELRTPLSAIMIWSRLLAARGARDPELEEGLAAIRTSAESQKRLIDDMLDSARITAGQLRLDLKPLDIREVVASAVDTIRAAAEAKGIGLTVAIEANVDGVLGDRDRLQQVVWNLLANAVKFTPEDGRIEVSVRREGREEVLRVSDTGRGIAAEFLPRIFQRFTQEESGTTRQSGGLGLGLAIVRQLLEMHNGTVEAESPGVGRGATFVVRLPSLSQRPPRRTRPGPPTGVAGAAPGIAKRLAGLHILLVEDEPQVRCATAHLLQAAGASVETADSAAAAFAAIGRRSPDVLVSDIGMPDEDGVALLQRIRESGISGTDRLPAIALTAFAHERDVERFRQAGFRRVIIKPFEPTALLDEIADAVRSGRAPDNFA